MRWLTTGLVRRTLGLALLIAGFQFAPFFPHEVASLLTATRAPLPVDFPTFYNAATVYRNQGNPYLLSIDTYGKLAETQVFPFLYPPTSLPIFSPLAFMRIETALLVFQILSFLCLVYVLFVVLSTQEEEDWPILWRAISLVALTSFGAIGLTFLHGQINIMATAAIMFAWVSARGRGRPSLGCAAALFIATLMKTYPLLLLILFLMRWELKVICWFIGFSGIQNGVSCRCSS